MWVSYRRQLKDVMFVLTKRVVLAADSVRVAVVHDRQIHARRAVVEIE